MLLDFFLGEYRKMYSAEETIFIFLNRDILTEPKMVNISSNIPCF